MPGRLTLAGIGMTFTIATAGTIFGATGVVVAADAVLSPRCPKIMGHTRNNASITLTQIIALCISCPRNAPAPTIEI